jgi:hypothetical protein
MSDSDTAAPPDPVPVDPSVAGDIAQQIYEAAQRLAQQITLDNAMTLVAIQNIEALLGTLQAQIDATNATVASHTDQIARLTGAVTTLPCPARKLDQTYKEEVIQPIAYCLNEAECSCGFARALLGSAAA